MPGPVFCDTRQQRGKHNHVNAWLSEHGVQTVSVKLDAGDYTAPGSNILIDTKKDVQELAGNVGRDHARFVRELDRAASAGCRLVVLVEEHPSYSDRDRLRSWRPVACRRCRACNPPVDKCVKKRFKPMQGSTVAKIIEKLESEHGARFEFCHKADSARRICELLGVPYGGDA
jgi:hypothetical protein|nr:MAG TPA: ATP-dependent RNA helicase [Caudoviricetes sp.]